MFGLATGSDFTGRTIEYSYDLHFGDGNLKHTEQQER